MTTNKIKILVLKAQALFFTSTIICLFSTFCFIQYNITTHKEISSRGLKINGNKKTLDQPNQPKEAKLIRLNNGIIVYK